MCTAVYSSAHGMPGFLHEFWGSKRRSSYLCRKLSYRLWHLFTFYFKIKISLNRSGCSQVDFEPVTCLLQPPEQQGLQACNTMPSTLWCWRQLPPITNHPRKQYGADVKASLCLIGSGNFGDINNSHKTQGGNTSHESHSFIQKRKRERFSEWDLFYLPEDIP